MKKVKKLVPKIVKPKRRTACAFISPTRSMKVQLVTIQLTRN